METKRYIEYDILRIFACFGVIMIHAAVFDQVNMYAVDSWQYQWINIWGVLSRWAVPAFVMLSGMMILPKADETPVMNLMIRRIFRMMVVYVVWSAVYSAYNVYVLDKVYALTKLKTFIDGCFSGELHMWYIPMATGLYIISPILSVLIKKLEKKWTHYWLLGMFLFTSVIPFMIKLDIKYISTIMSSINGYMDLQFLGGWTLYFVLGYYIRQHSFSRKEKLVVCVLAVAAFLFTFERTILYCMRTGVAFGVQNYEYPNIYLIGIGVVVFFKEEISRVKLSDRLKVLISKLSGLTFGIYLSHVLLLRILYAYGIDLRLSHPALSVPLVSFLVFVTGTLLTWIIHKIPVVGKYIA